jgi:hypothetical protein
VPWRRAPAELPGNGTSPPRSPCTPRSVAAATSPAVSAVYRTAVGEPAISRPISSTSPHASGHRSRCRRCLGRLAIWSASHPVGVLSTRHDIGTCPLNSRATCRRRARVCARGGSGIAVDPWLGRLPHRGRLRLVRWVSKRSGLWAGVDALRHRLRPVRATRPRPATSGGSVATVWAYGTPQRQSRTHRSLEWPYQAGRTWAISRPCLRTPGAPVRVESEAGMLLAPVFVPFVVRAQLLHHVGEVRRHRFEQQGKASLSTGGGEDRAGGMRP